MSGNCGAWGAANSPFSCWHMASEVRTTAIVDPAWQGWTGILIIVSLVFLLPLGCGPSETAAPQPPANPLAEKLPKLEAALEATKKRCDQILAAREKMETQRVQLLEKLREHGVTADSKVEELSPVAKAHRDEFVAIVRDMKEMKQKYEDSQAAVARIESTIRQLRRKLEVEDALVTEEDAKALDDANVLLIDVQDRLNPDAGANDPLDAFSTDALLDEQLGETK